MPISVLATVQVGDVVAVSITDFYPHYVVSEDIQKTRQSCKRKFPLTVWWLHETVLPVA